VQDRCTSLVVIHNGPDVSMYGWYAVGIATYTRYSSRINGDA
jgi:hypothetical protein